MLKEIPLAQFYRLINHGPCVLVSSGKGDTINVAPVAWTSPVNDEPPLVSISLADDHYTTELIRQTGEFVINVPSHNLMEQIISTGAVSGRKENKFRKNGLTPLPGTKVSAPGIKECIGFLECRVRDTRTYDGVTVITADVLRAVADDDVFDGTWISEKARTVHHLGGKFFAVIGKRFKA
jgi:flavin reductase (DIM6/NTAB) family NADH-FMN oxidoreductase RutF